MASSLPTVNDCCTECSGIDVTVTSATANTNLFIYDSIAALRAGDAPTTTTAYAIVKGIAQFYWQSNSTATDDGISIIKPSAIDAADPGRWLQQI